jgi:hypothetical protein
MDFYLIDFENVQCKTVGDLQPGTCRIKVFLGSNQTKLLLDFVETLQPFGSDVQYIKVSGTGPNALDFHIAFHIGRLSQQFPGAQFTIVSNDAGFDPLIVHLAKLGISCRRVSVIGVPVSTGSRGATAKSTPVPAKAAAVKKAPAKTAIKIVIDKDASQALAPGAGSGSTESRVDEAMRRLNGMKKAKPARLVTLKSSMKSWFKTLGEKEFNAVVERLTDMKKIKVTGAKVTYSLG